MGSSYDLLIRGATLVDPAQRLHAARDIAIADGRITAVAEEIFEEEAETVVQAAGMLVTPGLIDLHVHVYWGVSHYGIHPDPHCVARGATTVYDAGSSGADTFPGFKRYVIDVSATRIKAFLNISSQGMLCRSVGELTDIRYADVKRAIRMCEEYSDDIVGVKIRLTTQLVGDNGREGLKRAREVCDATGLPLMVHPNAGQLSLAEVLAEMRPGDILTHCFHENDTGVVDDDGNVKPEARKAQEGGILFDVGHGQGSFAFRVAEAAMSQGLVPGTISSDLHVYNIGGPVYDLATTVSKFLLLGLTLDEAIEKVTAAPARAMGMLGEIGTLKPGACADLSLFGLESSSFTFVDCKKQTRTGDQRLVPVSTIRGGRLYAPSAFDRDA